MSLFKNIEPKAFFHFFEEISAIPRGSGNREGIASYLVSFARERGLEYIRDDYDNVIIKKPAQGGGSSKEPVIIQGHTDMVTVAALGSKHDFFSEGIKLCVDGDYVKADGTTLGADDGVAVCYALAVLDDREIIHPPIEAVFTSDEEIGLIGAGRLDTSLLSGKAFLNIDSEDDGIFFAGCAGGATCTLKNTYQPETGSGTIVNISLTGLTGGHSGMEIDKHRANANKLLAAVISALFKHFDDLNLISFKGGEKDNAIATFAYAQLLAGDAADIEELKIEAQRNVCECLEAYKMTDPGVVFEFKADESRSDAEFIPKKKATRIIDFLNNVQDGVISMSRKIENVVETSSNLAITEIAPDKCSITFSVRSLETPERDKQLERIKELAGEDFHADIYSVYSAWSYAPESPVRDILLEEYKNVTGKEPVAAVIHAGLECGVFAEKMKGVDFVSFGPQADEIHTFNERLKISSVVNYWEILKNTLKRLA